MADHRLPVEMENRFPTARKRIASAPAKTLRSSMDKDIENEAQDIVTPLKPVKINGRIQFF